MTSLDRMAGTLLGTALGDALGLPTEGMSARSIARRFGRIDRFRLLGKTGFVSDDTEQAGLVAQSLARYPTDRERCVEAFRWSLLGWFCRLPWGVGLATVKACGKIGLGIRPSGVMSAGNGSSMRAAIVGAFFDDRPGDREAFGRGLAEVTHRDRRAIEGALYVAELASVCVQSPSDADRFDLQRQARAVVIDDQLGQAIDQGSRLARTPATASDASTVCGLPASSSRRSPSRPSFSSSTAMTRSTPCPKGLPRAAIPIRSARSLAAGSGPCTASRAFPAI